MKIKGDFTQKIHPLYLYNMHNSLLSVRLNTAQSPLGTALLLPFPELRMNHKAHMERPHHPCEDSGNYAFSPAAFFGGFQHGFDFRGAPQTSPCSSSSR